MFVFLIIIIFPLSAEVINRDPNGLTDAFSKCSFFGHLRSVWHGGLEFSSCKKFNLVSKMPDYVPLGALWDEIGLIIC